VAQSATGLPAGGVSFACENARVLYRARFSGAPIRFRLLQREFD
jgi:hypothetical protein